jgi:hypothetical protein
MKIFGLMLFFFSAATALASHAQSDQRHPGEIRGNQGSDLFGIKPEQTPHPNFLQTSGPVVPEDIATHFNEGLFTAKEQVHDQQINDLSGRVSSIEGTLNRISGAAWALTFFSVGLVAFIRVFWKGIVRVVLDEAGPRIVRP